ncbi:MAG: hypothetical protein IT579_00255 [Verrucomicrobia subdivision 3 bacterium]|nr:hypothetical protein [Limisphaerales bacterium]
MNARRFPAAATTAAALAIGLCFAVTAGAQAPSSPSIASIPPASTSAVAVANGTEDVLKLSRAKINDDVTVAFIQNSERRFTLTASEILYLRQEGVSDRVLTAMLSQPSPITATPTPAPVPSTATEASAPQYVTPPATTAVVETGPASTVYVATPPAYYSFYDPWPYWSSCYAYPSLSFGFSWGWGWGWGSCNYGYWGYPYCYNGYWNNQCHNSYYPPPPNGNPQPPNGNRPPPPNGNPPPTRGTAGQPGTLASGGRQPANVNPANSASRSSRSETRSPSPTPNGNPTSFWSNNGKQPVTARTSGGQTSIAAGSTSRSESGANIRTSVATANRSAGQLTGSGRSANQRPTAPTVVNQNAASAAPTSRISAAPPATYISRPSNPSATRYGSSPAASYQRRSSPNYNSGGSGSLGSVNRPSMGASYGSMGNARAFQGGGGFSGGGASHLSSGGDSRGGGGGGRSR